LAQVYICMTTLHQYFLLHQWSFSLTDTMWFSDLSGFNGIKAETR
jgi:hypothetical protein